MKKIMTSEEKDRILSAIANIQKQAMLTHCTGHKYYWRRVYAIYGLFLKPKDLAFALRVSEKTLEVWRADGVGPLFIKMPNGSVRYPFAELDNWLDSLLKSPYEK